MQDVMVDLETLGRGPGCVVLSIGAVAFGPEGVGPDLLYVVVNKASCLAHGLAVDADTEAWWSKQSENARQVLAQADAKTSDSLPAALMRFTGFLAQYDIDKVRVWGNGADFDNAILQSCYKAVGRDVPWQFWNNRCFRTLKSLRPEIKSVRAGTHHNALDDAVAQAEHAVRLLRFINAVQA
jgi:hypothetical protein